VAEATDGADAVHCNQQRRKQSRSSHLREKKDASFDLSGQHKGSKRANTRVASALALRISKMELEILTAFRAVTSSCSLRRSCRHDSVESS
jgi:hypothetical protein